MVLLTGLHVRNHRCQCVAIIWITGQHFHMGDKLAALAVPVQSADPMDSLSALLVGALSLHRFSLR